MLEGPALDHSTQAIGQLAVRYSGLFEVEAGMAGEFAFTLWASNDSALLKVNGETVMGYDNVSWTLNDSYDVVSSLFLEEGEHEFELLVANMVETDGSSNADRFDVAMYMRSPDSVTRLMNDSFVYQAIPDPASGMVTLMGAMLVLLLRRRCDGSRGASN